MTRVALTKIQELIQERAPLPPQVWWIISGVSQVHWYWRWYRMKDLYINPENWLSLTIGHAANYLVGDNVARTGAQAICIAARVQEHILEVKAFYEEWGAFNEARRGLYVYTKKERFLRALKALANVIWKLFSLTMHTIDIYDAFLRRDEAFNRVVVDGLACVDTVTTNRKALVKGIKACETIIRKRGYQVSTKPIIQGFERTVYVVENGVFAYRWMAWNVTKNLIGIFKPLELMGLHRLIPAPFREPVRPPAFHPS